MRWILLAIFSGGFFVWLHSVKHRNESRETVNQRWTAAEYQAAADELWHLRDSLDAGDSTGQLTLALAHTYYTLGKRRVDSLGLLHDAILSGNNRQKMAVMTLVDSLNVRMDSGVFAGVDAWQSAYSLYYALINRPYAPTRSQARNQLGLLRLYGEGRYQEALTHFREALLADPNNEAARYNYELVKKYLKRMGPDGKLEPTDYAKQLKELADGLIADRRYVEAYYLLEAGKWQDPSVRRYNDFIQRVKDISNIEMNQRPAS